METRIVFRRFITLLLSIFLISKAAMADDLGGVITLKKSINKDYSARFNTDYRSYDSELYYKHYEAGLVKHLKNNWSTSIHQRIYFIYNKPQAKWKVGHMPFIDVNKAIKTDQVDYGVRVRQEYIMPNNNDNFYRSRLALSLKPSKKFYSMKPFISDEVFYDHQRDRYTRNRFMSGIEYQYGKYSKYSIFYRHEYEENLADKRYWNSSNGVFLIAAYKI